MAVTVKKAVLWRTEIDNRPGMLASTLEPLSEAGADLQDCHGLLLPSWKGYGRYRATSGFGQKVHGGGKESRSCPVTDIRPAGAGGQSAGTGHTLAKAIGDAGINLSFVIAQVMGRRYSAMFGFENEADATRLQALIKKAAAPVRKK
jgi:hypothetical protein